MTEPNTNDAKQKAPNWSCQETIKMFELVQDEKEVRNRDVNSTSAHFWVRQAPQFPGKTTDQLKKFWSDLKTSCKSAKNALSKYPSGGMEPATYFGGNDFT